MPVRHQAERIGLALTTAAGPLTILADVLGLLDEVSPNGVQLVTLLILTSVTMFLLLEVRRFEILDSVDRRLAALDIDGTATRLRRERYGGVERVHPEFPTAQVKRLVREARTEVGVLQTWMPNLGHLQDDFRHALTDGGVRVRILLLFPSSEVANLRREALRDMPTADTPVDVKAAIEHNLTNLGLLYAALPDAARARLEVRLYNSLPSMAVYRADETYMVSSFLHSQLAINAPQTEIEGCDSARGAEVQKELDTLWEIGKPVELTDWRRSVDAMSFDRMTA
ncbi:hypothetical protein [Streptomyces indicus]|uniref:Uncharacterized protein n=1 Tax=Streptomyces indicus TaxID=417292 RepID=A0A1G9DCH3_9ACTN|nr:hypothetical protein [Streptomyces indicus]SDK61608.1 hypothetical protein SAMN05421806_109149 [Streptomyces indicus]